jgi:inner membrane protein
MSSKAQHFRAGVILGVVLAGLIWYVTFNLFNAVLVIFGSVAGSSAPDWLEIAWHTGGKRKKGWFSFGYEDDGVRHSLIPHRRITHWFLVWTAMLFYSLFLLIRDPGPALYLLFSFILSGWLHIKMDSGTSMGVPWIHPWKRTRPRFDHEH